MSDEGTGYMVGDTGTIAGGPGWFGRLRLTLARWLIGKMPYSIEPWKYVIHSVDTDGEVFTFEVIE